MYGIAPCNALPWSANRRDLRIYCDMVMDLDASLTLKLYVSTASGFATKPTDAPSNQPFRGVLQSFEFTRSIMEDNIGQFTTGKGTLVIRNDDAAYDFLPLSYAVDGRPIVIKVGRRDRAYAEAFPLARLTASGWNIDTNSITIDLEDYSYKLEVPAQPNVYGGTGAADGGSDLTGKRKPLVLGKCLNITPVLLVPNLLIYQVHDGSVQAIDAVYDRGAQLTAGADVADYPALAAASVAAGQYKTCKALGLFKLGSSAAGTVTADVRGDNGDGYIETTADIVRWALRTRTALVDPDDLDVASFTAVNAAQPAPIGYFVAPDDSTTVAALIQQLMGGIGGWGGHKLDGTFEVRIFSAPTGHPVASFTKADVIGDLKREALPDAYRPPPWRWRVVYARCWTVQTDLAGGVSADRKAFVAEQYRLAEATSQTILTDHPFAQDRDPVVSYFQNEADADAEAGRLINLWKTTRAIYRATLPRRALRRDMGDEMQMTYPRFDLSQGRSTIVVETSIKVDPSAGIDSVEVAAYG